MSFYKMIGQTFGAIIPSFGSKTKLQIVKLHGVEAGGLWLESQQATNEFLAKIGAQAAPKTAVFFVPYHQITLVISSLDSPSLNEKSFGV